MAMVAGSALLLAVIAFVSQGPRLVARDAPAANFALDLPAGTTLSDDAARRSVAVDRDGQQVAVVVAERDGATAIYRRRLPETTLTRVAGSEGAQGPTFSPDGRFLAFTVGRALRVLPVTGGEPRTLVADAGVFKVWTEDGQIVYGGRDGSLWTVPAAGGAARRIPPPDPARQALAVTPVQTVGDGRRLLVDYYHVSLAIDSLRSALVSLDDGRFVDLDHEAGYWGTVHAWSETGHLLMTRLGGALYAMPYDLEARAPTGPPRQLLAHVASLSLARNGTLAYQEVHNLNGLDPVDLYLVDLSGHETRLTTAPEQFSVPRVSPDGRRIALRRTHYTLGPIWTFDPAERAFALLAPDSTGRAAEWSADGTRVYFVTETRDSSTIRATWLDHRGADSVLAASGARTGWYRAVVRGGPSGVLAQVAHGEGPSAPLSLASLGDAGGPRPLGGPPDRRVGRPAVSPDGRWLAYETDEHGERGRKDVFVTSAVARGPVVQVSLDGGTEPAWAPDGRTLFYRGRARTMMAARLTTAPLAVVGRDSLFPDRYLRDAWLRNYDVMPDGRHLLLMRDSAAPLAPRQAARVVTNWPALLQAR